MDQVAMELKKFNIVIDDDWAWVDIAVNQDRGQDVTLLTVGDSWVWGDELGDSEGMKMNNPRSDNEYRVPRCFGNLLANKLGTNWLQLALPGGSNEWIFQEFRKMVERLTPHTKKIIAVVGFADNCRSLNHELPEHVDLVRDMVARKCSLVEIITAIDAEMYRRIDTVIECNPHVRCVAMPSFTNPLVEHHTQPPVTWNDLMFAQELPKLPIHTSGIWELNKFLDDNGLLTAEYKSEISDVLYPMVTERVDLMRNSGMFFYRCHPKEPGHELWANYLFDHITQKHRDFLSTK